MKRRLSAHSASGRTSKAINKLKMPPCPICGRQLIRLANHLRKVHNLFYNTTQPSTLKEFIQFLKLFPLSAEDWEYLSNHKKSLEQFLKFDKALPVKLFQIVYKNFDKYRSNNTPKLVVLNGLFPTVSSKNQQQQDHTNGQQ